MRFGAVPLREAEGAVLAHSVRAGELRLRKGVLLRAEDIAALARAGVAEVVVARLEVDDLDENRAAAAIAARFDARAFEITEPFTGRVNILAREAGVLEVDVAAIHGLNAIDPGITIATLPDKARVAAGTMLATVKIIPYGVASASVEAALGAVGASSLQVAPRVLRRALLVMTQTDALTEKALAKGEAVVGARLAALGVEMAAVQRVRHETGTVATALRAVALPDAIDLVLILGASATSDVRDVCPAALVRAGGEVTRFGMPVDPGNLLFLGDLGGRPVVGLPGCARSPALNGADWVLERLVSGLCVEDADIAAMGVGGLLKEIPIRPQPRAGRKVSGGEGPHVALVLLAAGQSRRMRGRDKLLEQVAGEALLRRSALAAKGSGAGDVLVVLPPDAPARKATLEGLGVTVVVAEDAAEGMAASLRAGLAAASGADAVIVGLADMPDVSSSAYDALIKAYRPDAGAEICRSVSGDGRAGHPVLFGQRFFESLGALKGDQGARSVLKDAAEFVVDVPLAGDAAVLDLDTPEQWAAYRARG